MIPKIIHQIHLGGAPNPETQRMMDGVKAVNSNFEYWFWHEGNIGEFKTTKLHGHHPASTSNIIRLMAVHKYGGIYLDTDFEAIKPMDDLISYDAWIPDLIGNHYCVAAFGAIPSHPWIDWQIKSIPKFIRPSAGWSSELADAAPMDGVTAIPVDTFFPYHWNAPESDRLPTENTYAEHKWAKSWWSKKDYEAAKNEQYIRVV